MDSNITMSRRQIQNNDFCHLASLIKVIVCLKNAHFATVFASKTAGAGNLEVHFIADRQA